MIFLKELFVLAFFLFSPLLRFDNLFGCFFVGDYVDFYAYPEVIDITAEIAYALGSLVFLLPVLIISIVFTNFIFGIISRNILLNSLALANKEDKEISVKFGSNLNPLGIYG